MCPFLSGGVTRECGRGNLSVFSDSYRTDEGDLWQGFPQTVIACGLMDRNESLGRYRQTSARLRVRFQTAAVKRMLQESKSCDSSGFPVHMKVMFTLYCSPLRVQQRYV